MKKKKVTYKELMEQLDFLFNKTMEIERGINYVHSLLISYISCNKHENKLKKYLKKESKKDGQTNGSGTKGNRENKPGDSLTQPKSK